jgi:TolB protein
MDPNGQNQTRLSYSSFDEYQPAWSSDRTKIAFVVLGFGGEEIYVMDAAGQNRTRLTNNNWHDHSPAWSPDGPRSRSPLSGTALGRFT